MKTEVCILHRGHRTSLHIIVIRSRAIGLVGHIRSMRMTGNKMLGIIIEGLPDKKGTIWEPKAEIEF